MIPCTNSTQVTIFCSALTVPLLNKPDNSRARPGFHENICGDSTYSTIIDRFTLFLHYFWFFLLKISAGSSRDSRAPVLKVCKRGGRFADSSSCDSNPKSSAGLSPSSFKEVQVKSTEHLVSSSLVLVPVYFSLVTCQC